MIAAAVPWGVAFFALVVVLHVLQAGGASVAEQSGVVRALAVFARERKNPMAALAADVVVALATPFMPGSVHAVVDAYLQAKLEARASRTMALTAMFQAPTLLFLALLAMREGRRALASAAVILVVSVAWAVVWSRFFAPKNAFADAFYTQHRGPVDWGHALSSGWELTAHVLKHNALRIVGLSMWGGWLVVNSLQILAVDYADVFYIAFVAVLALVFRIDPILILPIGVGRYTDGSAPEGLAAMFCVAAACATFTHEVLDERLKSDVADTWSRALRFTYAPLVAVAFIALYVLR